MFQQVNLQFCLWVIIIIIVDFDSFHFCIDPDIAAKAIFKKQIPELTRLFSLAHNRSRIATELFSEDLIDEASFDAVDDSSKSDNDKAFALLKNVKNTVYHSGKPAAATLRSLIDCFNRQDAFKPLAAEMSKELK